MRTTIIKGMEDDFKVILRCDAITVASVLEAGKAIDALVYEARITGEKVLSLMREFDLEDKIVKDHHYVLTAFDG